MGSTGTGSFTDYSKRKPTDGGNTGGSSGKDKCGQAFECSLEEVSRCFYYLNTGNLPTSGTEVTVFFNGVRISVETLKGEEIGYLPTKFNYIKLCIDDGFKYAGVIKSTSLVPTPSVFVDIVPV
ncbi:MAG: hypothetical protein J0L80_12290 [Chitinophagales bacterium]|nr:hypothetical protein [Chitinophagales bacterium]